jgi:lysophospholipase L1-like esterase
MTRSAPLLCLCVVLAAAGPLAAADDSAFFFKDGDRVVMIGDSITEQLLYSNYVEMWTVSRFPAWKLSFRNTGIGGDTSQGGKRRFARDVLAHHPTAMTVDFGMNDAAYRAFEEGRFKPYMEGLQSMADQAKEANIRAAWITPQPIEPNDATPALSGYNLTLEKFSAGVGEIAQKNGGLFVDQFHPYLKVLEKARTADAKNRIGGGDPVHPGPPGQALMASAILKGLHFPTLVAAAEIDAAGKKADGKNCKISNLEVKDGAVSFEQLDSALPFFPAPAASILKWAPIRDELNVYALKVMGLKPGNYEVRLGGTKVAEHSADELAKGVSLTEAALKAGPVADQVNAVWSAVQAKNKYFHDNIFRGVVLAGRPSFIESKDLIAQVEAERESVIKKRLEKMPELDAAIHAALAVKPHRVEIVPGGK